MCLVENTHEIPIANLLDFIVFKTVSTALNSCIAKTLRAGLQNQLRLVKW